MGSRKVCEMTPAGRGAVCVLQLRADNVSKIVQGCFSAAGKHRLPDYPLLQPVYGFWQGVPEPNGSGREQVAGQSREDVVICRASEIELEVHCHGGEFAKRRIIDSLSRLGFELVAWRDWSESTESSSIAAAASRFLPLTQTLKTASVVNWQIAGALDRSLSDLLFSLQASRMDDAVNTIDGLLTWLDVAQHLTEPWCVAIAGPPNVGKSSLMNRLVGFERSIVFDQPGTTRDLVSALTAINGWPVEVIDTAGLRETRHNIEAMGIDLARQALRRADLVVCVRDVTSPDSSLSAIDAAAIGSTPVMMVLNKSDLLPETSVEFRDKSILVSALTGNGIDGLIASISHCLVPVEPVFNQAIPFLVEQFATLQQAREACIAGDVQTAIESIEALTRDCQPNE